MILAWACPFNHVFAIYILTPKCICPLTALLFMKLSYISQDSHYDLIVDTAKTLVSSLIQPRSSASETRSKYCSTVTLNCTNVQLYPHIQGMEPNGAVRISHCWTRGQW